MFSIFWTNGQICSATSRLLLHDRVADRFLHMLRAAVADIKVGHPLADGVRLGPLVNQLQYDKVTGYIARGLEEGATLLCGGGRPDGVPARGLYVQPTVFVDVQPHMAVWREEIFGPVRHEPLPCTSLPPPSLPPSLPPSAPGRGRALILQVQCAGMCVCLP
jgi:betaine-aldehyde dehydrogenase